MPSPAAVAGPLISGAASVGSSFLGGLFGANEAKKNRDFQLEMWNRQNEYNKPINWRARMEEADKGWATIRVNKDCVDVIDRIGRGIYTYAVKK
jgi:hypothetical protein